MDHYVETLLEHPARHQPARPPRAPGPPPPSARVIAATLEDGEIGAAPDQYGSYRVLSLLGEGGMGRVYLAEHVALGRRVALKVLKQALAKSPDLVERFFAEAHAVNRIRHPGIVEATDFFMAHGTPCIVMELLEGRTLAEEIAASRLHPARAAGIGAQIALAIQAAHEAGVIHRDLKPDNVFLVEPDDYADGASTIVKVLDFGVAKLEDPIPNSHVHTLAGSIMGTPDYMAPEQLSGKPVDERADIYSLGALLFHAVTGRAPFQADNFGDLVVQQLTRPPPSPACFADVPPSLEQAIMAMLEKDPARRPRTMSDVALLLSAAQDLSLALQPMPRAQSLPPLQPEDPTADASEPMLLEHRVSEHREDRLLAPPRVTPVRPRSSSGSRPRASAWIPPPATPVPPRERAPLARAAKTESLSLLTSPPSFMRPAPRWAWGAVASLLVAAVAGSWALSRELTGPAATPETPIVAAAVVVPEAKSLDAPPVRDAAKPVVAKVKAVVKDDGRVQQDVQTVATKSVEPAPAKTPPKKAKRAAAAAKKAKVASSADQRRAVLDPFAGGQL